MQHKTLKKRPSSESWHFGDGWLEGYAGKSPMDFFDHQKKFMTSCFLKTGWSINRFSEASVFELGCGPLGMIEFIPSRERYAFDPLNKYYNALFKNLRRNNICYLVEDTEIKTIGLVDFGICFNVLDHTENAEFWFEIFIEKIKPGGCFLLQVNTVKDGFYRTNEHSKMHPSPIKSEQVLLLIGRHSDNFNYTLDSVPSADNEFFFMAWGVKK